MDRVHHGVLELGNVTCVQAGTRFFDTLASDVIAICLHAQIRAFSATSVRSTFLSCTVGYTDDSFAFAIYALVTVFTQVWAETTAAIIATFNAGAIGHTDGLFTQAFG